MDTIVHSFVGRRIISDIRCIRDLRMGIQFTSSMYTVAEANARSVVNVFVYFYFRKRQVSKSEQLSGTAPVILWQILNDRGSSLVPEQFQ